jgi:hypothetical protein
MKRTRLNQTPRMLAPIITAVACLGLLAVTASAESLIPNIQGPEVDKGLWFAHKYSGNPVISPNDGTSGIDDTGTAWGYFMTNGPNDYRMYYTGISGSDYDICLATSTDRIHWTRITNGIHGTHKVIDDGSAWAGPAWKEGSTYHMLYKKATDGYGWYHVTSANGISWGNATPCMGTLGTEISSLMKIGSTYHAWGSSSSPAKVYHFTSTDLATWTVQNGGEAVLEIPGSNVICPDIFYNVDDSQYYAVGTVTPYGADAPEKYYGSFRMWKTGDLDFQTKVEVGDLLKYDADTLPFVNDWENGANCDGQHFIWSDVFKQVHNSDPLFFYYSAEGTLDDTYDFSIGLVNYPTVASAIPEPSPVILGATGALVIAVLAIQGRVRRRRREM